MREELKGNPNQYMNQRFIWSHPYHSTTGRWTVGNTEDTCNCVLYGYGMGINNAEGLAKRIAAAMNATAHLTTEQLLKIYEQQAD